MLSPDEPRSLMCGTNCTSLHKHPQHWQHVEVASENVNRVDKEHCETLSSFQKLLRVKWHVFIYKFCSQNVSKKRADSYKDHLQPGAPVQNHKRGKIGIPIHEKIEFGEKNKTAFMRPQSCRPWMPIKTVAFPAALTSQTENVGRSK